MLNKLLKHELRATGRVMLPVELLLVLLGVLAGFSAKLLDSDMSNGLVNAVSVLFVMLFAVGLIASGVIAAVLMIQRFYKNLMCDEGYLMFTLPVSVDAHIISKLIISFLWFAVTAIACVLSLLLLSLTNISIVEFKPALEIFADVSSQIGVGNIVFYCLEALVLCFVGSCVMCLHFYACIAAGHSFSNHKVLLSIVFYFVISFLMTVMQMVLAFLADKAGLIELVSSFVDVHTVENFISLGHMGMLCFILYGLFLCALCYLPTTLLLKKRLNLA